MTKQSINGRVLTIQEATERALALELELACVREALDAATAERDEARRERDRLDAECSRWCALHNERWGADAATRLANLGEHALVMERDRDTAIARAERAEAALEELREATEPVVERLLSGDTGCIDEAMQWALDAKSVLDCARDQEPRS